MKGLVKTAIRRLGLASAVLWVAAGVASVPALCQTTGARLEGIVKDTSQAVVPGVTVTAMNEGTGISHTSTSNEGGLYVFVSLPPGTYTLSSELQGFKRYVNKGITLKVGDTITVNISLEMGDITTEVMVTAAAPLIDVTSQKIGSVVQDQQVLSLPLNGRNPMMLFYLQAGTNPLDSLGGQQAVGSVDGLRTNANSLKVEGVWASDSAYDMSPAEPTVAMPLEAVGEYRVTTSSASADAGRGSGAQIQVVYRSGTNNIHGSAFEFNRNTVYNANNFFSNRAKSERPAFLRNQYGVSLGGPIKKNKAFIFGTWEGQREIQGSIENRLTYTQTLRTGIFRYNTAKANSGADVDANGNPLVPFNTINLLTIDPSRLGFDSSGILAHKLTQIPLPNNYDIGDGFNLGGNRYLSSNPNHGNQFIAKIDYTVSPSHQLTVSLGGYWYNPFGSIMFSGYRQTDSKARRRNISIGLVSALRPTLTNEVRLGAMHRYTQTAPTDPANLDTKGNFQLSGLGSGRGTGSNGNPLGVFNPQYNPTNNFSFNNNLSWVKGSHTVRAGFEVIVGNHNSTFGTDEYIPAIYTSTANNPSNVPAQPGLASADRSRAQQLVNDLTGTIGHINQSYNADSVEAGFIPYEPAHRPIMQREWGAFFQDTWKVLQNLTLNYGVRWDLLEPGYMRNGFFCYVVGGSKAVLGVSGPVGELHFGLAPDRGKGIIKWDWNNLGPQIGFTWDPFKNGKTSISSYYRIAYDRSMLAVAYAVDRANQGTAITLTTTPFTRFSDPNLHAPVGDKPAILPMPLPPPGTVFAPVPFKRQGRAYAFEENMRTPYTQSWSLRVQREIVKDWTIMAAYVGNISVGGWRALNYNQIELRNNGFMEGFLAAQRNLAANGNPNKGESIGVLAQIFAPLGGIPSSQNTTISQGQVASLANFADTTSLGSGVRGGLLKAAGMPDTLFRLNPQVENASIGDNLSNSTWHALKLEVGKRFSQGTYLQFNYTFSKGLTDYVGGQGLYSDFRDNLNRRLDKTLQNYDARHIIQANAIWELPFGPQKHWLNGITGWKELLLGGWQINGIFTLSTSRPFTISSGRYNLIMGQTSTANYAGTDFDLGAKSVKGDIIYSITPEERALFSNPVAGSPGSTPFRAFHGPAYYNIDASMFKNFKLRFLGEAGSIQFRAEAFNIFNHTNFNLPEGNINSGSFGVISAAYAPRILQFGLRLAF